MDGRTDGRTDRQIDSCHTTLCEARRKAYEPWQCHIYTIGKLAQPPQSPAKSIIIQKNTANSGLRSGIPCGIGSGKGKTAGTSMQRQGNPDTELYGC